MARAAAEHATATAPAPPHAETAPNLWDAALAGLLGADAGQGDGSPPGDEVYLWPECVDAWRHWCTLQTQWRVGMAGATGLDYAAVRATLDIAGLAGDELREVFACIRAAEAAVLEVHADAREREARHAPH